jgi:hypothetical protein
MITLEQLVKEQKYTEMNDIAVIKTFFIMNNMEEEGMNLIHELTKSKVEKLKREQDIVKTWVSALPSKYLYQKYDLDTADRLHNLELNYISNGCELSVSYLKWAKENIPNIKMPQVYFKPLIEYLDSKDIRFKGEKSLEYKMFNRCE